MKKNRTYVFMVAISVALLLVLLIQVNWIVHTARIREELFNERANLVLSKTAEALRADSVTFNNLRISAGNTGIKTIDSLFGHFMKLYHFDLKYHFEVKNQLAAELGSTVAPGFKSGSDFGASKTTEGWGQSPQPDAEGCYKTCISGDQGKDKLELMLILPTKAHYIKEEMGLPFITSVLLILIVIMLFWSTILSLMKEKLISEHTTDFLNNMTHEFKTPLTNIALAGKMISREPVVAKEEKLNHYTAIILEENEKLRHQVEQVLSMTALERGEIPLQRTEINLHEVIRGAVKTMSLQVGSRQGRINLSLEAEECMVSGDKHHLANALCNLIDNSLKYSATNPEITIRTTSHDLRIVVEISDKGIGIDRKYRKKIFDKFFRVPTGDLHEVKGFGLGLAYVRRIIGLHDGKIVVNSQLGAGTTFIISLPYV